MYIYMLALLALIDCKGRICALNLISKFNFHMLIWVFIKTCIEYNSY